MRVSIQQAEPSAMVNADGLPRDHWQVVDRVAELELGGAANAARHRELAAAGGAIVERLASLGGTQQPAAAADDGLVQANESWLAVAATSERQLRAMSNPASADTSRVASQFIGETEKNLDSAHGHAQQSSAMLLFDEADALFGKRSDVKDSHD